MSYCRFIEADAYIFGTTIPDVGDVLECCGCRLSADGEPAFAYFTTEDAMLAHIAEHREAGHFIPSDVDARLISERDGTPYTYVMPSDEQATIRARYAEAMTPYLDDFDREAILDILSER